MATKRRTRSQAKPEKMQGVPRSALVNLWDWRSANPHLFPSDTSLRWHLRKYRADYIAAGALLEVAGRLVCDTVKMEQALREVGARAAAERDRGAT